MKKRLASVIILTLVIIFSSVAFVGCRVGNKSTKSSEDISGSEIEVSVSESAVEGESSESVSASESGEQSEVEPHTHEYVIVYDETGHWQECECGYKSEKLAHELKGAYDAEGHWQECECGEKTEKLAHELVVAYDSEGHWQECECGYKSEELAHELVVAYDAEGHWQECECGEKTEKLAHELIGAYDAEGHWQECECGEKTEKLAHELVVAYDAEGHWQECECGYKTEKVAHTLVGNYDAEGHWQECECGYKTEKVAHTLVGNYDAEGHWQECECGYKAEKAAHDLVYIYDVDAYHTECACGYTSENIAYDGYKLISAAYDYTAEDFTLENFATSGKALTFKYKPVGDRLSGDSDDVTFSLMSGWDRVTAYITVDITNNTVRSNDIYIGQVEDAGNGWYKVTINFSEMFLYNATGTETVDRMNFHWVNHALLLSDVEIVNAYRNDIEIFAAYDYTASDFSIENFATSGKALSFEYKRVEDGQAGNDVTFSLMSGWDRLTAYITVDITNNTVRSNDIYIGQVEDSGDGWYKITVNFAEMPLYNASGDETVDRMYFHWVDHAFLLADVEIVNAYRNGIEISAAYDYTAKDFSIEDFATSGKALTFAYKPVGDRLSGDSDDVTFSLMSGWDRVTAYITVDITNNTVRSNDVYIGQVEDALNGWYKVTINFSEMFLYNATGTETVDRMYFHWVNHAFLLADVEIVNAYRNGIEISAAYDYTASDFSIENFATSGKALTFEYKPVGDRLSGESDDVTFSLQSGWTRVTAYITVDITNNTVRSNEVYIGKVEYADDGWYKVTVNFADMPLNASGAETVDRMYFHWVNHAFLLYNVSVEKAYYTGEEISAAYGYSSDNDAAFFVNNFATSGKALSFEYKPIDKNTNEGDEIAFSLMSGWNRVTDYIVIDIVNDVVSGNIGTIEDVGDGWKKVMIKCSDMTVNSGEGATGNETVDRIYFNTVNHAFRIYDLCFIADESVEYYETTVAYSFSGQESDLAGYAEGTVILERQSGFQKGEIVRLYWGDEDGIYEELLPVAEQKVAANATELDFYIEENIVIPNGATKLFAYEYKNDAEKYLGEFDLPSVKRTDFTPTHIFASISDTHCNYPQGRAYLANALKEFIAAGVEFVINSGDIGESDSDYEKYVSAVEESGYKGLIFSCIGNHDQTVNGRANFFNYAVFDGNTKTWVSLDDAEEYFENEYAGALNISFDYAGDAEHKLYYYSVVIDNNAIVFMDQQLNSTGDTPNQDNFSEAELDFVEEFLEKYAGVHTIGSEFKYERYNLLIVEHSPVEQLKIGDKFNPGYGGAIKLTNSSFVNNVRFVNILKEYSEATWMSGHTHVQFDAGIMYIDKLYDSSGKLTDTPIAHAIHNSSLAQPRYYEGNSMIFYNDYHAASQGYICYQYSDRLVYNAHVFKPFTPDNGEYDENAFIDRIDAAHSYVIPLYTLDHNVIEPVEPAINYAVAENGIKRKGSFTFADTEDGLQVDFATSGDRFEVKLGDQTKAYENGLWLSFYIDTEMTAIDVGGCNSTGTRKTNFTINFAQSGSNYKLKTVNGKILIQMPISSLYHSDIITDLAIRFYNPVDGLSFTLSEMYIGEAPPVDYAIAANGQVRQGSVTFADTENGLKVDFAASGNRFEVKLGDQTQAKDNNLWLSFYIDTEMTAIDVGGCNSSGTRKTNFTIDFAQSGSNYELKIVNGKKFIQIPISSLYHSDIITDLAIRFYNSVDGLSFTLSEMYIGEHVSV